MPSKKNPRRKLAQPTGPIYQGGPLPSALEHPTAIGKQVAIFGAGITGLTAAHELVERGYHVEVFERDAADDPQQRLVDGEPCAIGGVARTQWASLPRNAEPRSATTPTCPRTPPWEIHFADGADELDAEALQRITWTAELLRQHDLPVEVIAYSSEKGALPTPLRSDPDNWAMPESERLDLRRAWKVACALAAELQPADHHRIRFRGLGYGRPGAVNQADGARDYARFHLVQELVPGEHGFRFFPSFYRNLFDTLGRIPIADGRETFHETPRTVLDNVLPTQWQRVAREEIDGRPERSFLMPRRAPKSPQEVFELYGKVLESLGFTLDDIGRFHLKLFKYMTSCSERRSKEYEYVSWFDFVGGPEYSEAFQRYFDFTAKTNVALDSRSSDARTHGNVAVQLTLDQFRPEARIDGTLNGPSTRAWFDPWRRYLESQGVTFHRGALAGWTTHAGVPRALVDRHLETDDGEGTIRSEVLERDYYVVAVGVREAQQLFANDGDFTDEDFRRLRAIDCGDTRQAEPNGALRHLSGVQFFLPNEGGFLRGHATYVDSPWSLSSIAQPQFWLRKRGWWDGYRDIVSVDIGDWDKRGPSGRTAWQSTREELAADAWEQLRVTFKDPRIVPRDYLACHVDRGIEFRPGPDGRIVPYDDRTPYLVNLTGQYTTRPGSTQGYRVHFGNLVLAGTYMQTHTRLTTMESANESARHAVNAILDTDGFGGERCAVFNLEDDEESTFRSLKELDQRLVQLGLPHLVDILDLTQVTHDLLGPDPDLKALLQRATNKR